MNPNPQLILDASNNNNTVGSATQSHYSNPHHFQPTNSSMEQPSLHPPIQQQHTPIVRFTMDRSVSWDDRLFSAYEQNNPNNTGNAPSNPTSSRNSRIPSGLSSPSITPALSPPLSRSRTPPQIHFSETNSTIHTITEAAARLLLQEGGGNQQNEGTTTTEDLGTNTEQHAQARASPRIVHFSAMRDITVVDTDAAPSAASSISNTRATSPS
eukprot:CAMPEP_0195535420 /NCGR_PEP_ID=MMETSP0794_2-20130614/44225_1 /TAXON_ID=515487 /ORGANISM="Stephanopyxis turris, Strain CCMP 815" /LENGTH=211 /DNA_ID=CAMNT_0040668551 /DNA_START=41 /DNA_END=673 /DNA_ORIENTATION=+